MGIDKATIQFDGQPLVARALGLLHAAGLSARIAGARSPLGKFASIVEDEGLGPLSGICAGLAAASADLVVFLPIDLPLLPTSLLTLMIDRAQITEAAVTVASVNGYPQTFPAVVNRVVLPELEASLRTGHRSCFAAFRAAATQMGRRLSVLPMELLVQAGQVAHPEGLPASLWFLNVNRPADLMRAETVVAAHRVS
jgi:molybdenum cofactor guanylyltransferase